MATKAPTKRGRGRPRKQAATDTDEQEPVESFRREPAENGEAEDEELGDPSLFKEMDTVRIPKLEKKGKEWMRQDDFAKKETDKAKALAEECILIMQDHEISFYDKGGVKLRIKSGKLKLEGETA